MWFTTLLAIIFMAASFPVNAACQPQCVAHARHSAKLFSHRVGNDRGAIDWFRLARESGHTQSHPGEGAIRLPLIFAPQKGLHPRFGHAVFVKSSRKMPDGRYLLELSHTNYAGRCQREHTRAYFNPSSMEVRFIEGVFSGRVFVAAGFING